MGTQTLQEWKPGVTLREQDVVLSDTGLGRVTLGRVGPSGTTLTKTKGAGFNNTQESNVQRIMYPDNFTAGGSWKDSSFVKRGPASERVCHPSLWPVEDARTTDTVVRDTKVYVGDYRVTAIPGYRGYIPGRRAETVFGTPVRVSQAISAEMRMPQQKTEAEKPTPYVDEPQGLRPLRTCVSMTDMKHSVNYGGHREENFAKGYEAKTNIVKDHEIPPAMTRTFSSPCDLGSRVFPGYQGYVPQRVPETAHLDWRTPQKAQDNQAVAPTYGSGVAGWSCFVPGRVAETTFGTTGMSNVYRSMATREYFDKYKPDMPQFPRGLTKAVPDPYTGTYEDLNLSKPRQGGSHFQT
jgi:hypothetical protein